MKMDLHLPSNYLRLSFLRADGLFETYTDLQSVIPVTPFDYRNAHRVSPNMSNVA